MRRERIEAQLAAAQSTVASLPRGSTAWTNAVAAVRQLERILLTAEGLPPTVDPHSPRPRTARRR